MRNLPNYRISGTRIRSGISVICPRPAWLNDRARFEGGRGPRRPAARTHPAAAVSTPSVVDIQEQVSKGDTRSFRQILSSLKSDAPPPERYVNALVSRLCEQRCLPAALELFRSALAAAVPLTSATCSTLAWKLVQARMALDAGDVLRRYASLHGPQAVKLTTAVVNCLLDVKERGRPAATWAHQLWQQLWEDEARRPEFDIAAYRAGLHACVAAGQLPQAEALLQAMRDDGDGGGGIKPDAACYNTLLKYYVQRGDMRGAQQLLKQVRLYSAPDIVTYNTLLQGFVVAGDLKRAAAVLVRARSDGLVPDAYTYTTYMKGLIQASDLEAAEELLQEMRRAGAPPTAVTYGTLVDGYVRRGDLAAAQRLVDGMQQRDGLMPNRVIFNTLLRGICELGGTGRDAQAVLQRMGAAGIPLDNDTRDTLCAGGLLRPYEQPPSTWKSQQQRAATTADSFDGRDGSSSSSSSNGYHDGVNDGRSSGDSRRSGSSSASGASSGGNSSLRGGPSPSLQPPLPQQAGTSFGSGSSGTVLRPSPAAPRSSKPATGAFLSSPTNEQRPTTMAFSSDDDGESWAAGSSRSGGSADDSGAYRDSQLGGSGASSGAAWRPDAASYTARAIAALRDGDGYEACLRVFDELDADPWAEADLVSLSALVYAHASYGRLEAAERTAERAVALAQSRSLRIPVEAFNALIQGYRARRDLKRALAVYRQFLSLGGVPHVGMVDCVAKLCLDAGDVKLMAQAVRAAQLVGVPVDPADYMDVARGTAAAGAGSLRQQSPPSTAAAWAAQAPPQQEQGDLGGANVSLERLKWWLGLPSSYYTSEWRPPTSRSGKSAAAPGSLGSGANGSGNGHTAQAAAGTAAPSAGGSPAAMAAGASSPQSGTAADSLGGAADAAAVAADSSVTAQAT